MKTGIVLTTINVPTVLEKYVENCKLYGHEDVFFVVVGDRKTPPQAAGYVQSLQGSGFDTFYLGIPEQEVWLERVPEFGRFLPYDSVERRNIGYLYAAERGAGVIISIDDDNAPLPEYDYVGDHGVVGNVAEREVVSSSSGWLNVCWRLQTKPWRSFYHRGFPTSKRWILEEVSYRREEKRIVVNAGLWLGDPDVDTVIRLGEPFTVSGITNPRLRQVLAPGTSSPFSSQNTAFSVDLLPCLYLIAFEFGTSREFLAGDYSFRYDDIWMSYFAKKMIDHVGDAVCFGPPHVEQQRNEHDSFLDVRRELGAMEMTNKLIGILAGIEITEGTYFGAYGELIDRLRTADDSRLDDSERDVLKNMTKGMALWLDAVSIVKPS